MLHLRGHDVAVFYSVATTDFNHKPEKNIVYSSVLIKEVDWVDLQVTGPEHPRDKGIRIKDGFKIYPFWNAP